MTEEREVRLTSAERVLWPGDGITKGDLFDYYREIAPVIVPHLRSRPFTMRRWREGIAGSAFFQKQGAEGNAVVDQDAPVPDVSARRRLAARRLPPRRGRTHLALDGADALHRHERLRGLEAEHPALLTTEWLKEKRRGVLVDHR